MGTSSALVEGMAEPVKRSHPEVIARDREHRRRGRTTRCPADGKEANVADCACEPPADDLEACWQGAARMARARRDADEALSAIDLQALDRYPNPTPWEVIG
jgi:hypothetical protein